MPARPLPGRLSSYALQIGGADGRTNRICEQTNSRRRRRERNMGANAFRRSLVGARWIECELTSIGLSMCELRPKRQNERYRAYSNNDHLSNST